jgi:hypothetical protein
VILREKEGCKMNGNKISFKTIISNKTLTEFYSNKEEKKEKVQE